MLLRKQLQRPLSQRSVAPLVWTSQRLVFPIRLLHGSSSRSSESNVKDKENGDDDGGGGVGSGGSNTYRDVDDVLAGSEYEDLPPRAPQQEKKKLSLYEELFPGESNRIFRSQLEEDEEPPRLPPRVFDVPGGLLADAIEGEGRRSIAEGPRRPGGMLILSATSKNLMESDFMRLAVRGRHVEGWVGGLLKVIQARDPVTLEPFDYYFVLFDSRASAAAYSEELFRLWKLSKPDAAASESQSISQVLFPSRSLSSPSIGDGEGAEERAIRSFTLAVATQRHYVQQVEYPRTPDQRWERMWGAAPGGTSWAESLAEKLWPVSPLPSKDSSPDRPTPPSQMSAHYPRYLVLLGVLGGDGRTTPAALKQALDEDGEDRNLPWRIPGLEKADESNGIVPLGRGTIVRWKPEKGTSTRVNKDDVSTPNIAHTDQASESSEAPHNSNAENGDAAASKIETKVKKQGSGRPIGSDWKYKRYAQFLISFAEEAEAQRFVREWHTREIALQRTEVLLRGDGMGRYHGTSTGRLETWEERREVTASLIW